MSQVAGRLSIIQACAYDDTAMTSELRDVLGLLGTYSDQQGYCYPSQSTLGERLGILRESVNRRIRRLAALGYLVIEAQYRADGGRRASRYRLTLDFQLPPERWRIPPTSPDEDGEPSDEGMPDQRGMEGYGMPPWSNSKPPVRRPHTPPVADSHTPPVAEPRTTLNVPIERPNRTTQGNAAAAAVIDPPARARAREDGSGGGGMPSLSLEKIAEAARMAPSGHFAGIIDRHALNMPPADLIAEASKAAEWQADHPDKQPHMTLAFLDNWFLRARAAAEEDKHHAERSAASNGRGTGGRPRTAARAKGPDINDFGDVTDWLR